MIALRFFDSPPLRTGEAGLIVDIVKGVTELFFIEGGRLIHGTELHDVTL